MLEYKLKIEQHMVKVQLFNNKASVHVDISSI